MTVGERGLPQCGVGAFLLLFVLTPQCGGGRATFLLLLLLTVHKAIHHFELTRQVFFLLMVLPVCVTWYVSCTCTLCEVQVCSSTLLSVRCVRTYMYGHVRKCVNHEQAVYCAAFDKMLLVCVFLVTVCVYTCVWLVCVQPLYTYLCAYVPVHVSFGTSLNVL